MIVRWGLEALGAACAEAGVAAPLVVAGPRWDALELPLGRGERWREVPSQRIDDAAACAAEADGVLAVGGGSAIDLGKAISAATGLPLVSVPTTYSGAEWTAYFGIRDPERHMRGGGAGAHPTAIVYASELTLDLPRETTVGTALNALAHCAEALYADGHNAAADRDALTGAQLISEWLPRVVEAPRDREARAGLLRGASHAGAALGGSMLALAHAMAQAIGGRYGLPHGTLNGICLPPALRFNTPLAPDAVRRFGEAIGADDPAARVEELSQLGFAELGRPPRLSDLGVPERDLPELAAAAAGRAGNRANPRSATAQEIEGLLHAVL
jgi:maleylacetate reductase